MRGGLHVEPDIGIGEDTLVVAQAHVVDFAVQAVGAEVRKAEVDRPDQRKDVDREKQEDRRANKDPRNRAVAKTFDLARNTRRRGGCCAICWGIGHEA